LNINMENISVTFHRAVLRLGARTGIADHRS
jgi:hypothetical protein